MYKNFNEKINIVLAADTNYAEPLMTLIKSICYHHSNVRFYLFHKEFSNEWFDFLNVKLKKLNSEIIPVLVLTDKFKEFKTLSYISETVYYRYLISEIPEDRLLYLDIDIVIDGSIKEFYFSELNEHIIGAIPDMFLDLDEIPHGYKEFPVLKPYFNAGVLLINNKLWKKEYISNKLVEYSDIYTNVYYGDQDILNFILKDKCKIFDKKYNFQVNATWTYKKYNLPYDLNIELENGFNPTIIHYTGKFKPWSLKNAHILLKDRYWFYYSLSWNEIFERHI